MVGINEDMKKLMNCLKIPSDFYLYNVTFNACMTVSLNQIFTGCKENGLKRSGRNI